MSSIHVQERYKLKTDTLRWKKVPERGQGKSASLNCGGVICKIALLTDRGPESD